MSAQALVSAARMLVADGKVTVYYPQDKLAEVYPMGPGFQGAAAGPLPRLSGLKESFELTEIDAAKMMTGAEAGGVTGRVAVCLTPRSDELKKHVASVRVLIDESVPCAERIVMVDPDGDETELRFTTVRINSGVKDSELGLNLPDGTRVSSPAAGGK